MLFQTVVQGPSLGQSTNPFYSGAPAAGPVTVADFLATNPLAKAAYNRASDPTVKTASLGTPKSLTASGWTSWDVKVYGAKGYMAVRAKLTAETQYVSPEALQAYMTAMITYIQAFDAGSLTEGKGLCQTADNTYNTAKRLEAQATGVPTTPVVTTTPPPASTQVMPKNLVEGVDYKCTSTYCYGLAKAGEPACGAVCATFKALQQTTNRLAAVYGTPQAGTPDGNIGKNTAVAVAALRAKFGSGDLVNVAAPTPNMIAARAVWLAQNLNALAAAIKAPAYTPPAYTPPATPPVVSTTPPGPGTTPGVPVPGTTPGVPVPGTYQPAEEKSNTIWWVVGGLAALALVGVVGYTVYSRKKSEGEAPADEAPELPASMPGSTSLEPAPAMSGMYGRRRHVRPRHVRSHFRF